MDPDLIQQVASMVPDLSRGTAPSCRLLVSLWHFPTFGHSEVFQACPAPPAPALGLTTSPRSPGSACGQCHLETKNWEFSVLTARGRLCSQPLLSGK